MRYKKGESGNPNGKPIGAKNRNIGVVSVSYAKHLIEDLIGTFKSGRFYVYRHTIDGQTVYIGKGKGDRAWEKTRSNYVHSDLMKSCQVDVRIIASDLSEEEALAIESVMIKINNPIFNINGVDRTDKNQTNLFSQSGNNV